MKKMGLIVLCLTLAFGALTAQAATFKFDGGSSAVSDGNWAGNGVVYPASFDASMAGGIDITFYGVDGSQMQFNNINWEGELKGTGIAGVTSGTAITGIDPSSNSVWINVLNQNTPSSFDWNGIATSTIGPDDLTLTADDTRSWLFQSWYRPATGDKTGHPGDGDPAYNTESWITPSSRHTAAPPNPASFYNKFDMRLRITPVGPNEYTAERWIRMYNSAATVEGAYWVYNTAMNNSADAWRRSSRIEAGDTIYALPMTGVDLSVVHPFVGVANWTLQADQAVAWDSIAVTGTPAAQIEVWVDDAWIGLPDGTPVILPGGATGYIGLNAFANITAGVAGVLPGGTVHIAPGLYEEQVVISKEGIILAGSGTDADPAIGTIIKSPVGLSYNFLTGNPPTPNYPIVGMHDIESATIENCRIDGAARGTGNYRFQGIAFWNAGGIVTNCYLTGIQDAEFSGSQHGVGIYAYNNTGGPYTLNISGTQVIDAQKTGMALSGNGLTAHVTGCTVIGHGPTPVTAQNGIQLGYWATGTISNCEVSGIYYSGSGWVASGILLYYPNAGVSMTGNNVHNSQEALYAEYADDFVLSGGNIFTDNDEIFIWGGANTTVSGNTFTNNIHSLYFADVMTANTSGNTFTNNDNAIIADGVCSDLTFSGNDITGSGISAVVIQPYVDNYGGSTSPTGVVFSGNNISGNGFGIDNTTLNMIAATGNWWGDESGPSAGTALRGIAAANRPAPISIDGDKLSRPIDRARQRMSAGKEDIPQMLITGPPAKGIGNAVSNLVDYSPWWEADYVGDVHGAPWNWGLDNSNSSTIQEGVDLVSPNDRIDIIPGLYEGQVVVAKEGLTLAGSGFGDDPETSTIIKSPSQLVYNFMTPGSPPLPNYPIVGVHDISGITLENCRIDGAGRGNSNYRFNGIAFWNAGGTITDCYLTGIQDALFSGAQHGVGIYAYNNTGGPYTLNITGTQVVDAQKTGMALSGNGLTANVTGCTVSGHGATAVTAQNGIQISYGAIGAVSDCHVSGMAYSGGGYIASGMLFYQASAVNVTGGSSVNDGQACIVYQETNGSVDGVSIHTGGYAFEEGISIREYGYTLLNHTGGLDKSLKPLSPLEDLYEPQPNLTLSNNPTTVNISNAEVIGSDMAGSYGIACWSLGGPDDDLTVTISNSDIEHWEDGIITYDGGGGPSLAVSANHSTISQNTDGGFWTNASTTQVATENYWGSYCGPYQATTNPDGGGNQVYDNISYDPWCNETFTKCDFSNSTQPTVVWVDDDYTPTGANDGHFWCYDAFNNIENGISAVVAGGTVNVLAGTYVAQITITKSLSLIGTGNPIVQCPAGPLVSYSIPEGLSRYEPMILAYGGINDGLGNISGPETIEVTITGIDVNGTNAGTANRFVGILLRNCLASTAAYNNIYNMLYSAGNPETSCLLVYGNSNVTIDHNIINDFSRGGIIVNGDDGPLPDPTAAITNNTVVGEGPLPYPHWAQNGIQIGYGATGSITGNEVSDIFYAGPYWAASGIVLESPSGAIHIAGNNVHDCQAGIYACYDDGLLMENNIVTGNDFSCILGGDAGEVRNNTFDSNNQALWVSDATNLSLHNNSFSGNSYGIFVDGVSNNVTFATNTITGNTELGASVQPYDDGYGTITNPTNIVFSGNNISGNALGMDNSAPSLVVASGNWWGDIGGPTVTTTLRAPSTVKRPLASSAIGSKQPDRSDDMQAPTIAMVSRSAKANGSSDSRNDVPKIMTGGDGISALIDYSPWWGANYAGDPHASYWNWFLNQTNSSTIQEAVNLVATGDSVYVLPDTYTGTGNRDIDFGGKNIKLFSTAGLANTIIDCGSAGRAFNFHDGENSTAEVNGFTIKNGSATGNGGAIICESSSAPTVSGCLIINNHASGDGGAVYCDNSNLSLLGNTIAANKATGNGGGLAINNASPIILNTLIWQDTAASEIYVGSGSPNITYSDIQGGWSGEGNINCNPQFCGPDAGNFHISDVSCALGSGFGGVKIGALDSACIGYLYIEASAGEHGTIDPEGDIVVQHYGSQGFTITPDPHYHILSLLVDGVPVDTARTYTFDDIRTSHTIAASFTIDTYTIAASAGEHGTIDPVGDVVVNWGVDQSFAITPELGYHIVNVFVDGTPIGAQSNYTFPAVDANHTISATFAIDTFTITASVGEHGSIAPSGSITVNYGVDTTFTITPDFGYDVLSVVVDGEDLGPQASHTFTHVTGNHTISATFTIHIYTITATSSLHGTIDPVGAIPVAFGGGQTFNMTPALGYHIAAVTVDGNPVATDPSYTFDDVSADHTINVTFAIDTFIITATAGAHGGISPSGDVVVEYGANQDFIITPDPGYHVVRILVDGVPVGIILSVNFTFSNVTADHMIEVIFDIDVYSIAASAGLHGSISPVGTVYANYGDDVPFGITPDPGYQVDVVLVDDISIGAPINHTFIHLEASHTIEARFEVESEAPEIVTSALTDATIGLAYAYDVDATGVPAPAYSLTSFPFGMTIDPVTGLIQWTPSSNGTFEVRVVASNEAGTDFEEFTIHVMGCDYIPGDVNGSHTFTGSDVVFSVNFFKGGLLPLYYCECTPGHSWFVAGDVNGSCSFTGQDVTRMVMHFKSGLAPVPCPDCPPVQPGILKATPSKHVVGEMK